MRRKFLNEKVTAGLQVADLQHHPATVSNMNRSSGLKQGAEIKQWADLKMNYRSEASGIN